jgi:hypothetical protein
VCITIIVVATSKWCGGVHIRRRRIGIVGSSRPSSTSYCVVRSTQYLRGCSSADRASVFGTECRGFKSLQPHQIGSSDRSGAVSARTYVCEVTESEAGSWDPLSIGDAAALFSNGPLHWHVGGGIALELFCSRSWRSHDDIDIGVLRGELPEVRLLLRDWDIQIAAAGVLSPWDGRELFAESDENNLWVRREQSGPWRIDVQIGDGNDEHWTFRRDPSITLPWDRAIIVSRSGVPYLAPEVQLLFKSKNVRPKDEFDAREVIPELDEHRMAWLSENLPTEHPWRNYLVRGSN